MYQALVSYFEIFDNFLIIRILLLQKECLVLSETHKGLKRVTLICLLCPMLVIIHFWKLPYLEQEEETTDQSNFVNNVT